MESDRITRQYFERIKSTVSPSEMELMVRPVVDTLGMLQEVIHKKDLETYTKFCAALTIEEITSRHDLAQISRWKRENAHELNILIMKLFIQFSKSFSITNNLTGDQIRELTAEITVNYWHLSLEDIALFLQMEKRGQFGPVISLDVNRILKDLRKYDEDRTEHVLEKRRNESWGFEPYKQPLRQTTSLSQHMHALQTKYELSGEKQLKKANTSNKKTK